MSTEIAWNVATADILTVLANEANAKFDFKKEEILKAAAAICRNYEA